jgi:hypothetical protein
MNRRKLLSTLIALPVVATAENLAQLDPVQETKCSCSFTLKSDDHRFTSVLSGTQGFIKKHILKRFRKSFKNGKNIEFGILVWSTEELVDCIVKGERVVIYDFEPHVSKIKFGEEQISYLIDSVILSHKYYLKNKHT